MKDLTPSPFEFSSGSAGHLSEIRKWTLVFSILGFILIGFSIIVLPAIIIPSTFGTSPGSSMITVLPVILTGLIYFLPVYFLLRFSVISGKAINLSDPKYLEDSFRFLKYHYRSMGVIFGLMIIFYAIAGIIMIPK